MPKQFAALVFGANIAAVLALACGGAAAPTTTPTSRPVATAAPGSGTQPTPGGTAPTAASTPTPTRATAPTAAPASRGPLGKMEMAAVGEIANPDTHAAATGGQAGFYNTDVNAGLLAERGDAPAGPWLAESWAWEEKGLKVRFVIRKGARFHNGKPVTSDDILFTVDKVRSPYAATGVNASAARWMKNVEAIDDRTVVFTMPEVFALGWNSLGSLIVQPRHDPYVAMRNNPIGAGPYRVMEWRAFESITLEASPYWWDADKVQIKTIHRLVVPEPESRLAMLKSGQVDFIDDVQSRQAEELLKDKRFRVKVAQGSSWVALMFSTDTPVIPGTDIPNPFLDVRVRRAFIMAVDRKAIVEGVALGKYGYSIPGPWHRSGLGGSEQDNITPYPYDPKAARQLLEEAKFPFDREWPVWYYRSSTGFAEASEVAVAYWNTIGIKARGRLTETATIVSYVKELPARTYPIRTYRSAIIGVGEPSSYLVFPKTLIENNGSQFLDEQLDAWGRQLRTAFEPAERELIYRKIYQRIHEQALNIPLLGGVLIHAFSQRVDYDPLPQGYTVSHLWHTKWMPGYP